MTNADYITPPTAITSHSIDDFIDTVFSAASSSGHRLFWANKAPIPGFPSHYEPFKKVERRGGKRACYFATSTMQLGAEGKLYNRQNLFDALHVVVLDDIGTGLGSKCTPEQLPEALRDYPTYIIESSPNNFQYGYVLDSPITDIEAAKALVRLVVSSSGADTGGCMPNKLVRMPCGYNLKDKYSIDGQLFNCRLTYLNTAKEDFWSPSELLDASGSGSTWEQVLAGEAVRQQRAPRAGTTAYRVDAYNPNLEGVDDPVVGWLNERGMLVTESNTWLTVKCPWASGHSDGTGDTAGYMPLGAGEMADRRAFHCFHETCSGHKTGEFLQWVAENGGPLCAVVDPVGELVAKYSLDMSTNEVINMKSGNFDRLPVGGFKNGHMRDVWISTGDGKMTKASEYGLFIKDINLMRVSGVRRQPGGDRLLSGNGDDTLLNGWSIPDWGAGSYDADIVDVFTDFIGYLLPEKGDAAWFLDHLASKVQNPQYRGAGIVMTTPVQGTGRGTMEAIIRQLWGAWNVNTLRFGELIRGLSGEGFNDWIRGDWLVIPEAKEANMSGRAESRAYESLKSFVEPGGVTLRINRKNVPEWYEECFGSLIICSQHASVINMEAGDTRFRRMENTVEPRSYDYFKGLRDWMGAGFEPHLWRYLAQRDISHFQPFARSAVAGVEDAVTQVMDTGSGIDAAVALCVAYADRHTGGLVYIKEFIGYLRDSLEANELGLNRIEGWERILRKVLKDTTKTMHDGAGTLWQIRVDGKQYRPRHTVSAIGVSSQAIVATKHGDKIAELKKATSDSSREKFLSYCASFID